MEQDQNIHSDKIRIAVIGAKGKMGRLVSELVEKTDNFVFANDENGAILLDKEEIQSGQLSRITPQTTDVAVEFTVASQSPQIINQIVAQRVNAVVGTSGWKAEEIEKLKELLAKSNQNNQSKAENPIVAIIPNFSISAVLLERFAADAAKWFESVEVIEFHHPEKIDAPSATAAKLASVISSSRKEANLSESGPDATKIGELASRGAKIDGVNVHALRLRSATAGQEVIFGNIGEQFSLKQETHSRNSFELGIKSAIEKVQSYSKSQSSSSLKPQENPILGLQNML